MFVINRSGIPNLGVLSDKEWRSDMTILNILRQLETLLEAPFSDKPVNPEAGSLWETDRDAFYHIAEKWTLTYACSPFL